MPEQNKPLSDTAKQHLDQARVKGVLEGAALKEMIAELGKERVMRLSKSHLFSIQMPPEGLGDLSAS